MSEELVQTIPAMVATAAPDPTPMRLLEMAMMQGADITKLQQLMDLQEKFESREARKAFVAAMNQFKAHPPVLVKDRSVAYKDTKYKFTDLGQITDKVVPALSAVGITHRWVTEQIEARIRVTCVLTHELGWSEETTLEASPDLSGGKNNIQAVGSTVSYLQRYTLLSATGLATSEQDDDARFGLEEGAFQGHKKALLEAKTIEELVTAWQNASQAAKNDKPTLAALARAKDERKAQLRGGLK